MVARSVPGVTLIAKTDQKLKGDATLTMTGGKINMVIACLGNRTRTGSIISRVRTVNGGTITLRFSVNDVRALSTFILRIGRTLRGA